MSYLISGDGKWRLDKFTGEFWKNENGEIFCSCGAEVVCLKNDFCERSS